MKYLKGVRKAFMFEFNAQVFNVMFTYIENWGKMTDKFLSKFEFFKLQLSVDLKAILIMRPDLIF